MKMAPKGNHHHSSFTQNIQEELLFFYTYLEYIKENQSVLEHRLLASRWTCGRVGLSDSNSMFSVLCIIFRKLSTHYIEVLGNFFQMLCFFFTKYAL